jgi:hypothetical protein
MRPSDYLYDGERFAEYGGVAVVRKRTEKLVAVPEPHLIRHTPEQLRRQADAIVARLPEVEDVLWLMAADGDLYETPEVLRDLDRLDALDYLATGKSRGCHYGACSEEPYDISWRSG